jgi:hypothetical protein
MFNFSHSLFILALSGLLQLFESIVSLGGATPQTSKCLKVVPSDLKFSTLSRCSIFQYYCCNWSKKITQMCNPNTETRPLRRCDWLNGQRLWPAISFAHHKICVLSCCQSSSLDLQKSQVQVPARCADSEQCVCCGDVGACS